MNILGAIFMPRFARLHSTRFLFQALLAALSVRLEVRSAAHGANPHVPYALCAEQFFGADADVVGLEMKVMTKARTTTRNKGGSEGAEASLGKRLSAAAAASPAATPAAMTEMLLRSAWLMHGVPRRPAVFLADGALGGPRKRGPRVKREGRPPPGWMNNDSLVTAEVALADDEGSAHR